MKPALQTKVAVVKEITDNFKNANSAVVVEYQKLTVAEFTQLRRMLAEQDVSIKVYKNNLVDLAAKEAGFADLSAFLTGPNAFAFGTGEQMAAAKTLAKFAKTHPALKLKAGIYEGKVLDTKGIVEIASLPTKNELIAMFASSLLYPLRMFAIGVKEIAKTRSE
ncbi:50S ribosomal protein L10 [Spiroplasma syrphidicola EA-1]|uniref:Large ribosomal subunit protein uL10 n=1 Tax=Spiroplasma syrphidicola EA-1 TaxID=1276229 RepID=R4UMU9_9MOLU|nr:50S ribosomal protein L10 [Spiroplasma syrphidicola]AGM26571.1 50S ribosomal protein L10 [Spiroplasma syrphidicola EA-1]